ncbi:unnamed protein product [Dovyalis caffra]|uniref:Uncharacterized protein n=1 Tax=Dovyalis caffra TaxID=77055 RepID=A0AAV1S2D4_9ROSI|nr:unnamed protein product [Dovyalis caffra]
MQCGDINGWVVLEAPLSALPAHGVGLLALCLNQNLANDDRDDGAIVTVVISGPGQEIAQISPWQVPH